MKLFRIKFNGGLSSVLFAVKKYLFYGERLCSLGLLSIQPARFKIDTIKTYKMLHTFVEITDEASLSLCHWVIRDSA